MSTTVNPSASPVSTGNAGRVVRFLATRVGLSLITLWLLSVIVFAGGQLLPGDIVTRINDAAPDAAQSPAAQIKNALANGPVRAMVQRGPSTSMVILRATP